MLLLCILLIEPVAHQALRCLLLILLLPIGHLLHIQLDKVLLPLKFPLPGFLVLALDSTELPFKLQLLAVRGLDCLYAVGNGAIAHFLFDEDRAEVKLAILNGVRVLHVFLVQLLDVLLLSSGYTIWFLYDDDVLRSHTVAIAFHRRAVQLCLRCRRSKHAQLLLHHYMWVRGSRHPENAILLRL